MDWTYSLRGFFSTMHSPAELISGLLVPFIIVVNCDEVLFTSESCPFFISFPMEISHYLNFLVSLLEAFQENKCYFFQVLASATKRQEAEHSF